MPHSEIEGSKPILGSPSLIAEYHVLHRLLLPRHPPNALLALDLIQKKTGQRSRGERSLPRQPAFCVPAAISEAYFPALPLGYRAEGLCSAVSRPPGLVYLTWIVTCLAGRTRGYGRTARISMITDVYLSIRCKFVRLDGAAPNGAGRSNRNGIGVETGVHRATPRSAIASHSPAARHSPRE